MARFSSVRGRVARPASVRWNLAKLIGQKLIMWPVFYGVGPAATYRLEARLPVGRYRFASRSSRVVGVLLFVAGWLLSESSAVIMVIEGEGTPLPADAPRKLVIAGPYRYVRNPMAIGSLMQGFGIASFLGSPLVAVYISCGMLSWNYVARPWEEMDLERRFGEPYARYRDSVRCWVPRLRPYEGEGSILVKDKGAE